jgi:hypothetical protein
MRSPGSFAALLSLLLVPMGAEAIVCSAQPAAQPLPVRTTPVPPLAAGLAGRPVPFVSSHALLAESRDESLALDVVLLRLRLETCTKDEYANYKPRTQFDNTPWRFNMEKGKKFDAAQFDAWMKSRGVRVAKGNPAAANPAATAAPAAPVEAAKVVNE